MTLPPADQARRSRVAVVTGGAGGIGTACVKALLRADAEVVVWDASEARLDRLDGALRAEGMQAHLRQVDITETGAVRAANEDVRQHIGAVDILVNCAARLGMERERPFWTMSEEQWRAVIRSTFETMLIPTQVLLPGMIERRRGRIISLSSAAAHVGSSSALYAASKAAIEALSRSIALSVGRYGITVNCVAPALVRTEHTQPLITDREDELVKRYATRRIGEPEDISAAVTFFASPAADWITGQTIRVDGGLTG